jgi:hypothetical protein
MGLAWLNTHSESSAGKKFLELSGNQRNSLFEPLGFKRKARPGEEDGRRFFALVREYTHSRHVCAEVLIASGELEESGELQRFPGLACMRLEPAAWGMIRRHS